MAAVNLLKPLNALAVDSFEQADPVGPDRLRLITHVFREVEVSVSPSTQTTGAGGRRDLNTGRKLPCGANPVSFHEGFDRFAAPEAECESPQGARRAVPWFDLSWDG